MTFNQNAPSPILATAALMEWKSISCLTASGFTSVQKVAEKQRTFTSQMQTCSLTQIQDSAIRGLRTCTILDRRCYRQMVIFCCLKVITVLCSGNAVGRCHQCDRG